MDEEYSVLAAHVVGAHGVGGNVRLHLVGQDCDVASRSLQAKNPIQFVPGKESASRFLTLTSLRRHLGPKDTWIAHFKEIKDRNDAEELAGGSLFIPETARAVLADGEYYIDELIGAEVVTEDGKSLGRLTDVLYSPAHDIYETDSGVLIPAVSQYLLNIDVAESVITVRNVPGMINDQ